MPVSINLFVMFDTIIKKEYKKCFKKGISRDLKDKIDNILENK